jgi:hypothetical protein
MASHMEVEGAPPVMGDEPPTENFEGDRQDPYYYASRRRGLRARIRRERLPTDNSMLGRDLH